jgi:hypothetical protein
MDTSTEFWASIAAGAPSLIQGVRQLGGDVEHCYYEYFKSPLSWSDAEAACVVTGGHLASIRKVEDQKIVDWAIPDTQATWIGAANTTIHL